MDPFEGLTEPTCPEDGTVMVIERGAYRCRGCGHTGVLPPAQHPGDGDGIIDFR